MIIEDSSPQAGTAETEEQVEPLDLTAPLVEVVSIERFNSSIVSVLGSD